jgi:hypothetical protein
MCNSHQRRSSTTVIFLVCLVTLCKLSTTGIVYAFCLRAGSAPRDNLRPARESEGATAPRLSDTRPTTSIITAKSTWLSPPVTRRDATSSTNDDGDEVQPFGFNAIALLAWIGLIFYTVALAPGEMGSPLDNEMLEKFTSNPLHPEGINPLYVLIFNLFAFAPYLLAAVTLPSGQPGVGLPALPFLAASTFIGYFGYGPYQVFRAAPPRNSVDGLSWFTKNVTENKIVATVNLLLILSLPFVTGVVTFENGAIVFPFQELFTDLLNLASKSKFVSVSLVDLTMLYGTIVANTATDFRLREQGTASGSSTANDVGTLIAASSALVPFVGSVVYCMWRHPVTNENDA